MINPIICPTITAFDPHSYRQEIENVKDFATRIHIDLMDGIFTETKSPDLDKVWWPQNIIADIHLMYKKPSEEIDQLVSLKPSLVIFQYEAEVDHQDFALKLKQNNIKVGISLLQHTDVGVLTSLGTIFDHVLIFSGHLGFHGGEADLGLLSKVKAVKAAYPDIEISWDGGINDLNASELINSGVNVLNVGSFVQGAEDPANAYAKLEVAINR